MSKTIILVRHAEYKGHGPDPRLSSVGIHQARYLADLIKAAIAIEQNPNVALWTSPARRASDTAAVLQQRLNYPKIVVLEKLWSDNQHPYDFDWLKQQLDEFDGEHLVIVSHLEYVQRFPCVLGHPPNRARYAEGVIISNGECVDLCI